MKLREIAKTVQNINKIKKMLNSTENKHCLSLYINGYNFKVYSVKELSASLKEVYNNEVVFQIMEHEYYQENTNFKIKTSYLDYSLDYKVELFVYEEVFVY